jgi:transcriptional regulator with XRE-family HTH domain
MRSVFSANLRQRMHEKNMSQSDLARAIWKETRVDSRGYEQPVNKDRVSAWVNSRVLPNLENMQKVAEALGVSTEDLLPELESVVFASKPTEPATFQPDFVFKMDDGGFAIIELKCRVSLDGAQELMAVYAKHVTDAKP